MKGSLEIRPITFVYHVLKLHIGCFKRRKDVVFQDFCHCSVTRYAVVFDVINHHFFLFLVVGVAS